MESVRPLVVPKLREENERGKGKGKKNKGVKDVVVEGMPFQPWEIWRVTLRSLIGRQMTLKSPSSSPSLARDTLCSRSRRCSRMKVKG